MVVSALASVWPPGVEFVITDNGAQFLAQVFAQLATELEFMQVRIAPHRPGTNGIAERFVLTLKDWLQLHTWATAAEFEILLAEFLVYYNDRHHHGAELDGLSPNEFTRRLLDRSTC